MVKAEDLLLLAKPTPNSEKKYRVGRVYDNNNGKGTALTYVDARYVMDTLDSVVGAGCWADKYERIGSVLFCTITITFVNELGELATISKSDCGTESNVEKEKGEASDAFKRCAVKFGIGRDLYSQGTIFISNGDGLENKGGKWQMPFNWKPSAVDNIAQDNWVTDKQKERYQELLSHPFFKGKKQDANNYWRKIQTKAQADAYLKTMEDRVTTHDAKNKDK
jgi:hypothetical protein